MRFAHEIPGTCPVCTLPTTFVANDPRFRDYLQCARCSSIPRERALMAMVTRHVPRWRTLRLHESSPGGRFVSLRLQAECPEYVATHYHPDHPPGTLVDGARNEDLERQTFPDSSFDLVLSLDVLEHVFHPDAACREIARTLAPGGHHIFTAPTWPGQESTIPRAIRTPNGTDHLLPPEHHGNPVDPNGSLVTYDYGYDLAGNIAEWTGMDVQVTRFADPGAGILGDFTEVYVCRKPGPLPSGATLHPATPANFSEPHYLAANPDVWAAVIRGNLPSGRHHFDTMGQREARQQLGPKNDLPA